MIVEILCYLCFLLFRINSFLLLRELRDSVVNLLSHGDARPEGGGGSFGGCSPAVERSGPGR